MKIDQETSMTVEEDSIAIFNNESVMEPLTDYPADVGGTSYSDCVSQLND